MSVIRTELRDRRGVAHVYVQDPIPALEALSVGRQLVDVLGASLRVRGGVGDALRGFASAVLEHGHQDLLVALLSHTRRDGELLDAPGIQLAYTGNLGELLRCVEWVVEENYADFFGAVTEVVGSRVKRALLAMTDDSAQSWVGILSTGLSGSASTQDSGPGST